MQKFRLGHQAALESPNCLSAAQKIIGSHVRICANLFSRQWQLTYQCVSANAGCLCPYVVWVCVCGWVGVLCERKREREKERENCGSFSLRKNNFFFCSWILKLQILPNCSCNFYNIYEKHRLRKYRNIQMSAN